MDDEIKKPSFLVYYDNEVVVLRLSDEEAGKLFKSLFRYGRELLELSNDKYILSDGLQPSDNRMSYRG
ncbi:MAG: hypothetical protein HFH06_09620 [Lachnospiraceae bacterium]|nr:hypothetical protein [Lachnospiraceae bacterium]